MEQPNSSEQTLLDAVKELIAIPSTADDLEALRAAYNYMRGIIIAYDETITVEEFESGGKPSFLAYRGESRPEKFRIILNAHIDVVPGKPEQYCTVVKDGKLYGRGTYDMKAAAIILTRVFCEYVDKVPYPLALQVVTDEESAGRNGTLYQVQQGVRADFVICGECGRATDAHEIANEAKGIILADIVLDGESAHAAYPWKGDNAAAKAANFIQAIHARYPIPEQESNDTTVTVTSISTNSDAHNKIADLATVKVDARYVAGDPNFESPNVFAAHIRELYPGAVVAHYYGFSAPLYADPDNPLILELKAAAEEVEGTEFTFARRHATSDGRFYGAFSNQACEFGIAGEHQHGDDEHITLQAFYNYLATMRAFLDKTLIPEAALEELTAGSR